MTLLKHYFHDDTLRASFNALAEQTFGLNFENWYQNGFWTDAYDPYSIFEDGRIVANVSLNRTDMVIRGQHKRLYQLGTVMTAPEYRNRGYIRAIMAQIEKDTAGADGVYLFANDSVLSFYPKFGFTEDREYVYTRSVAQSGPNCLERVPMDAPAAWEQLGRAMVENTFPTACSMVDNPGLLFFYAAQFMSGCVFLHRETGAWIIAEQEAGQLTIHNIFSAAPISLDAVIAAFGESVTSVTLGFTPADPAGFDCRELKGEDCTFFTKGPAFEAFAQNRLRIPSLSHA